jgi:hypothetical protein
MKGCYSGADFSRDIAMGLKLRNIETTKVSSRLGVSKIEQSGRVMVDNRSGPSWPWQLDLQLPMQSVPITTDVSSHLDQVQVYNIM